MDVKGVGRNTTLCLAAAHALVELDDGTIVGDPMEKTTLEALDWVVSKGRQDAPAFLCLTERILPRSSNCQSENGTTPNDHIYSSTLPVLLGLETHVNDLASAWWKGPRFRERRS